MNSGWSLLFVPYLCFLRSDLVPYWINGIDIKKRMFPHFRGNILFIIINYKLVFSMVKPLGISLLAH